MSRALQLPIAPLGCAQSGQSADESDARPALDPEVLVERITFSEARDYVRIVQRNRAMYGLLYDGSLRFAKGQ